MIYHKALDREAARAFCDGQDVEPEWGEAAALASDGAQAVARCGDHYYVSLYLSLYLSLSLSLSLSLYIYIYIYTHYTMLYNTI